MSKDRELFLKNTSCLQASKQNTITFITKCFIRPKFLSGNSDYPFPSISKDKKIKILLNLPRNSQKKSIVSAAERMFDANVIFETINFDKMAYFRLVAVQFPLNSFQWCTRNKIRLYSKVQS